MLSDSLSTVTANYSLWRRLKDSCHTTLTSRPRVLEEVLTCLLSSRSTSLSGELRGILTTIVIRVRRYLLCHFTEQLTVTQCRITLFAFLINIQTNTSTTDCFCLICCFVPIPVEELSSSSRVFLFTNNKFCLCCLSMSVCSCRALKSYYSDEKNLEMKSCSLRHVRSE